MSARLDLDKRSPAVVGSDVHHPDITFVLVPSEIQELSVRREHVTHAASPAFELGQPGDRAVLQRESPVTMMLTRSHDDAVVDRLPSHREANCIRVVNRGQQQRLPAVPRDTKEPPLPDDDERLPVG